MAAVETGWFRTESGVVLQMDLPLPEGIAQRVARSEIVRVADAAGNPWVEPGHEPPPSVMTELREQLAAAQARVEDLESEKVELLAALAEARAELERLRTPEVPTESAESAKPSRSGTRK